ncbi:homeodomain-interacting protein kinase 4 [Anomaloglossus baeobatrachus]|uniref:homeodomain-interacting protein kinase 4 n=1 Tax=Anomaloglossus baeobatrachus TaxID=238106 RepID=UPI003F4F4F37
MALLQSKTGYYHVIEELGRGTFGNVLKAEKKETGQLVAIKMIQNDPIRSHVIKNEIKLLSLIRQGARNEDHLIHFFEHFYIRDTCYFVFELLQKNLFEYQKEIRFAPIPLRHIRTITTQVLEALSKLKALSIIHADLKPENIVLVDQVRCPFRVKVIDFGSASILSEVRHVQEPYIQSRFYRAPEILLGLPFCEKLDMWSLGCIIAELHFGYPLYPGNNEYGQVRYICQTQGLPDDYLLNVSSKVLYFFKYSVDPTGKIQWRIKTEEEYQMATRVKAVERRKYILNSLDQIKSLYTTRSRYPESEVLAERYDLRNMVELMKRMLTWDSKRRINPTTALKHPFIYLQHLKMHYKNTKYYEISRQCQDDATHPEQATYYSMPPGNHQGFQSPNYFQGQMVKAITDGEQTEKIIEQINCLCFNKSSEKTSDHKGPAGHADLSHDLPDSPWYSRSLPPESREEIVVTQLDNSHTSKTTFNGLLLPPRKPNIEDHSTLEKPETETKQHGTTTPINKVWDDEDEWKTGEKKCGECSKKASVWRTFTNICH